VNIQRRCLEDAAQLDATALGAYLVELGHIRTAGQPHREAAPAAAATAAATAAPTSAAPAAPTLSIRAREELAAGATLFGLDHD
jgi:hypothetical protein